MLRSVDHFAWAPDGWATTLPAKSRVDWSAHLSRQRSECETLIARLQRGEPALSTDGDDVKHVIFGDVLALSAREKSTVTVLDYGGNLGDHYWLATALVPGVQFEYHCKELPAIAAVGRELSPAVIWHTDDACLLQKYDVVMFSSSLQYLPEWKDILGRAAAAAREYLFLSNTPTVQNVATFVATERTAKMTNLLWQLNRAEVVETVASAGLRLIQEFAMGPYPQVANAPEQPTCAGWLFQR